MHINQFSLEVNCKDNTKLEKYKYRHFGANKEKEFDILQIIFTSTVHITKTWFNGYLNESYLIKPLIFEKIRIILVTPSIQILLKSPESPSLVLYLWLRLLSGLHQ